MSSLVGHSASGVHFWSLLLDRRIACFSPGVHERLSAHEVARQKIHGTYLPRACTTFGWQASGQFACSGASHHNPENPYSTISTIRRMVSGIHVRNNSMIFIVQKFVKDGLEAAKRKANTKPSFLEGFAGLERRSTRPNHKSIVNKYSLELKRRLILKYLAVRCSPPEANVLFPRTWAQIATS